MENDKAVHSRPRVSIAVGIYNCADTLGEAIKSILKQTYADWELILCDDGSTDDTLSIAKSYAARDTRIRVVRNLKNLGLNHSLNHCLREARGEFYARMDGDDISAPDRFMKLVAALDANPEVALVSSWMTCFDEIGEWGLVKTKASPTQADFIYGTPFCHAPCMVRIAVMRELDGYGTESWLRRSQDYHLWFRLYAAGHRGINLQEPLYRMRNSREATSRRSLRTRLMEARIMWFGFRLLHIAPWHYIRILRPILLGIMPGWLYERLHRWKRSHSAK
jgi:glycosyltransferase EpsE